MHWQKIFLRSLVLAFFLQACAGSQPVATTQPDPVAEDTVSQTSDLMVAPEEVLPDKGPYRGAETRYFNLQHTRLDLRFDWQQQHVIGQAEISLKPYFYPQEVVLLDAKGFDIRAVELIEGTTRTELPYSYDGLALAIDLPRLYTRDEQIRLAIDYTAKPEELPVGGSAAITADKGLYFINPLAEDPDKPQQIWTQGETEANSKWFPTIDAPNQKMTQEIYLTVNNKYTTLSNGVLVSSRLINDSTRVDYWKLDQPHAPYLTMLAIGEFARVEDSWNGLAVDYYVEPEYEAYAKDIFGNTPEMMTFFSELLDYPYPWPKYAQVVVRDYVSGAMENTTASVFMEALQVDDRALLDEHWDYIIAHELFHQWFGDLVTCESWSNLTLNEAFANYSEYLWNEYKYGEDAAGMQLLQEGASYFNEAQTKQVDLIRYYYDDKEDMFDSHSYAKGGRILHMLRSYLGDEAFFAGLHYYLTEHEYQPVEVHDLRLAFEKVSGEDLNWFFNQWFLASGHPQLEVTEYMEGGELILSVRQVQDLNSTPLYKLPVYVDVYEGEQPQRFAIDVEEQEQEFSFPVSSEPQLVIFDAEEQLLAQVLHEKTADQLIHQYRYAPEFVSRYKALVELASQENPPAATLEVFREALKDSSYYIRQLAVQAYGALDSALYQDALPLLVGLSTDDANSLVRAEALALLGELNPATYQEQLRKGLSDRSYAVVAAAVQGYTGSGAADVAERIEALSASTQPDLVLVLADYYATEQIDGKYNWFLQRLDQVSGGTLFYLTNLFGQYLLSLPAEQVAEGAARLETLATSHPQYYIRYAAFNALALQDKLPNLEETLRRIADNETDERLLSNYRQLLGE